MKGKTSTVLALFLIMIIMIPTFSFGADEKEIIVTDPWGGRVETGARAYIAQGEIWIPSDIVKWYTDAEVAISREQQILLTFPAPKFRLETSHLDQLVNQGVSLSFPYKLINGKPYLNAFYLEGLLGVSLVTHANEGIVELITAYGLNDRQVQINTPRKPKQFTGKLNLVWDHVSGVSRNVAAEQNIRGLDVISPTWFAIVNEDGLVLNKAEGKYVADAHAKQYQVWALLSNSFDKDLTRKILASEKVQENIIKQIVTYASIYNLDGINIDFENMYDSDKDRYTAFVRKLGAALREQNVVLSVDVTVPSKASFWSLCYDRKALGEVADYIMVMAYDEHSRMSPVSGSVASLDWVEKGIVAMLTEVPKEKLLLGIPFYTREWEETITPEGKINVQSRSLSMSQADKKIVDNQAVITWLEDKRQHYTEYYKDGKRYRIWLEDKASINQRISLVHKHGLAGTAAWRKDFEKDEIWKVLQDGLKNP